MLLGAITYKNTTILDFSPQWVIGTPKAHISFNSLEDAKQWLDEFFLGFEPQELFYSDLKNIAIDILRENYSDISKDRDFWYGISGYDFNYHDLEETGFINIDIYPLNTDNSFFSI